MFNAIRDAIGFLGFDELPKDERPPRSIWDSGKELRRWFKAVEARREEKYGLKSGDRIEGPVEENDVHALLGLKK